MNKHKSIVSLFTVFTLLLVGCSNPVSQTTTEENNQESQHIQAQESSNEDQSENEEETRFITEAFDTLLNYDNTTYEERTANIENYFVPEIAQNIVSTEHVDTDTSVQSSTSDEHVYKSMQADESYIYKATISHTLEDNPPTELTNIYMFTLLEDNGEYAIDELEVISQPIQREMPLQVEEEEQVEAKTVEEQQNE